MRRPGGTGNGDGAMGGHDRRPAVAGWYGAEVGRHGKVRNGDAAPLPVPKRRCGVTTASEAKMRRQGRNGQRRRSRPARRAPMMEPSRTASEGGPRTAEPPEDAHQPEVQRAKHEAVGGRSEPRGGEPVGVQPAKLGRDRGARGVSPRKNTASHSKADRKVGEDRATPGGYGGKPPGVAFIGVPTGARNAGRCSDGGPEHRYACYTETPPCASRLDYGYRVRALFFLRPATDCLHPG
jgi:hypothetical protein